MTSLSSLLKHILGIKQTKVEGTEFVTDENGVNRFYIDVKLHKRAQNRCPICGAVCPGYDKNTSLKPRVWRSIDFAGALVFFRMDVNRIECPEHGVLTAAVPWAFHNSRFTKTFDMQVAWLAREIPRKAVSEFMRIDWKTVGRCLSRSLKFIEPHPEKRLDGLVNIGIDETSFRKHHKYITVVINHDTGELVWVHKGCGFNTLKLFFEKLDDKQKKSIQIITGDGAKWIDKCIEEYVPHCIRCVDTFHVVQWAGQAVDEQRRQSQNEINATIKSVNKEIKDDKIDEKEKKEKVKYKNKLKECVRCIKNSIHILRKGNSNLNEKSAIKLKIIETENPDLHRAYELKEQLRLVLQIKDKSIIGEEIDKWIKNALLSKLEPFKKLGLRIQKFKNKIINTVLYGYNNARVEAINSRIKLVLRKAYGFRNLDNMFDMLMLVCSRLVIPLPNRGSS